MKHVEAHFNLLPPSIDVFDHCKPAAWLFENSDAASKFAGFDASRDRMAKVIADLNSLIG